MSAKRPWKLVVAGAGFAWNPYGSAFTTEEKALEGVRSRLVSGEFGEFDGSVCTPAVRPVGLLAESGELRALRVAEGEIIAVPLGAAARIS